MYQSKMEELWIKPGQFANASASAGSLKCYESPGLKLVNSCSLRPQGPRPQDTGFSAFGPQSLLLRNVRGRHSSEGSDQSSLMIQSSHP